tara:strand:+ start:1093 stop:1272 length:180 start_codon:yes stop_codon:yes gene_type:complete
MSLNKENTACEELNFNDETLDLSSDDEQDDHVNIQEWCQDLEAIESLESLDDNFNYMEI